MRRLRANRSVIGIAAECPARGSTIRHSVEDSVAVQPSHAYFKPWTEPSAKLDAAIRDMGGCFRVCHRGLSQLKVKGNVGLIRHMECVVIVEIALRLIPRVHAVESLAKEFVVTVLRLRYFDGARHDLRGRQASTRVAAAALYSWRFIRAARQ